MQTCNLFNIIGAFLVKPELKFVLQQSIFVKLGSCLLCCKSTSYHTISSFSVLGVLFLGSTRADCHEVAGKLLIQKKGGDFWTDFG